MPDQGITIELEKLPIGRKNAFLLQNEQQIPTSSSAIENKSHLRLRLGEKKDLRLFKREIKTTPDLYGFDRGEKPDQNSDRYIFAWNLLKRRGMPVLETIRKIDDTHLAVTDLSLYGTVYDVKIDRQPNREKNDLDKVLLGIPQEEIEFEAMRLLQIANKNGIELPYDGPFHIFINKTLSEGKNRLKVMLLDLSNVAVHKDVTDFDDMYKTNNTMLVNRWLESVKAMRQNIEHGLFGVR